MSIYVISVYVSKENIINNQLSGISVTRVRVTLFMCSYMKSSLIFCQKISKFLVLC